MKRMKMEMLGSFVLIGMILLGTAGFASEQATTIEAVDYSKLIALLPDAPTGWEGEEPSGMTLSYENGTWSMASRSYSKLGAEDVTAEAMITDYALYTVGWSGAWKFFKYTSPEGYAESAPFKGFPAWEVYNKASNTYSLHVGINDRFLVFITTNSDKDTLYKLADSIDYSGIAALGGAAPPAEIEQPAPTPMLTPTPTPTKEEEGKVPGFEALAAAAGVLAVAYLLRLKRIK